jgi:hypothetical protein
MSEPHVTHRPAAPAPVLVLVFFSLVTEPTTGQQLKQRGRVGTSSTVLYY